MRTILWGVFCACSWTWCIGMYLPVIMLKRYGWLGFLAFAIPNVIGCAAFGYVLRTAQRSRKMLQAHGRAAAWFSVVTVAYHLFFTAFFATEMMSDSFATAGAAAGTAGSSVSALLFAFGLMCTLFGIGYLLSALDDGAWLFLATIVYGFSLVTLFVISREPNTLETIATSRSFDELRWLAPVITIGFLLSPYLDLTFHRALRRSPSPHAFGVFGLTFAAMLLLTCFMWFRDPLHLGWLAVTHLALQSVFTVGAHLREIRLNPHYRSGKSLTTLMAAPWLAGLGYLIYLGVAGGVPEGEKTYLRFLVFYGLVFPAYVLLRIGPGKPLRASRRSAIILLFVILACLPLYEAGFIHGQAAGLLLPATAAVIWVVVGLLRKRSAAPRSAA